MGSRARPDFQGERCGTGAGGWQAPARRGEEIIGQQLYFAIARFSLHLHPASTPLRRDSLLLTCYSSIYYFGGVEKWIAAKVGILDVLARKSYETIQISEPQFNETDAIIEHVIAYHDLYETIKFIVINVLCKIVSCEPSAIYGTV